MSLLKKTRILIIYSTTNGQCFKISKYIANKLDAKVDLVSIQEEIPDLKLYDGVIIGASIRYGVHRTKVKKYIDLHYREIQSKLNAFFSISLVARKPERRTVETNPYVKTFLQKIKWKPKNIALIAGVLNYPSYSFLDRIMIQLIMKMTQGPTDSTAIIEYTDWNQVENFAQEFNFQLSKFNLKKIELV